MNLVDNADAKDESASSPALLAALTTEDYMLQASRSSTVVEANGRSSLFVSATSAATVALALVAQLDDLGGTFMVFTSVVLPALLVLGLTSYSRLADLAVQDAYYARAIGRIRAFYVTLDPAGLQYWMQPAGDDANAIMRQAGHEHTRWHHFSHTATSVAAVTAVIAGALLGLALSAFSPLSVPVVAVVATVVGSALFGVTWLDQERRWRRSASAEPTRFLADGSPAHAVVPAEPRVPLAHVRARCRVTRSGGQRTDRGTQAPGRKVDPDTKTSLGSSQGSGRHGCITEHRGRVRDLPRPPPAHAQRLLRRRPLRPAAASADLQGQPVPDHRRAVGVMSGNGPEAMRVLPMRVVVEQGTPTPPQRRSNAMNTYRLPINGEADLRHLSRVTHASVAAGNGHVTVEDPEGCT